MEKNSEAGSWTENPARNDECLRQHPKCGAMCCKVFSLRVKDPEKFKEGMILEWPERDPSNQWYFDLRGARVRRELVRFELGKFAVAGNRLIVHAPCRFLQPDLWCAGHPDKKPRWCREMTRETAHNGDFYVTPGCAFE